MGHRFFVYILANLRGAQPILYTGVTNDPERRVAEHRLDPTGFVARYARLHSRRLECMTDSRVAIAREKRIKGWSRVRKMALVESANPEWRDLLSR